MAAHIDVYGAEKIVYKNFSPEESYKSSTWRELFAIYFAVISLKDFISCKKVQWHTDNYAATLILESGSNKEELQTLSEKIFEFSKKFAIDISAKWVPRDEISYTDALSKRLDHDEIKYQFFY